MRIRIVIAIRIMTATTTATITIKQHSNNKTNDTINTGSVHDSDHHDYEKRNDSNLESGNRIQ